MSSPQGEWTRARSSSLAPASRRRRSRSVAVRRLPVANAVAAQVEGKRVRAQPYEKVVFHNGRRLAPEITVAEAGIAPLDHVRVEYDHQEATS